MTAEPDRIVPGAAARLVFLEALKPLPLVDPTEAARLLKVKRHTLACYRDRGSGPAYYKFGRWVRYAPTDLRRWIGEPIESNWTSIEPDDDKGSALVLVNTPTAARFLTITRFGLENYRQIGGGHPLFVTGDDSIIA